MIRNRCGDAYLHDARSARGYAAGRWELYSALFSGLGSHALLELFVFLGIQISVEVFGKHLSYTDEYSIYARLQSWGYGHKHVNHGRGEFARDDDGDGLCEVHVNTMEGFWSLLRSWLRPHRGIAQEKLPLYLGFFEFVHNVRRRGKALLPALIELLVT